MRSWEEKNWTDQQKGKKFDLVPIKHEYGSRWNRYPKKISSLTKPYVASSILHSTTAQQASQGNVLCEKPWRWEIFQASKNHWNMCVCVNERKKNNKKNLTQTIHMMLQKSTRQQRISCEMELNNRKTFWLMKCLCVS